MASRGTTGLPALEEDTIPSFTVVNIGTVGTLTYADKNSLYTILIVTDHK